MTIAFCHEPRPGDVLGFSDPSWLGAAVNLATWGWPGWGLSHVGIVGPHPYPPMGDGALLLYESTSLATEPCALQERMVKGVQAHPLAERLSQVRGRVWQYRLRDPLTELESRRLLDRLLDFLGLGYDYLGAFRLRTTPLGWVERLLYPENLHSIFCSELCADGLRAAGRLWTANASRWSPNRLGRALVRGWVTYPADLGVLVA